jgi:hypothetical protein
MARGETRLAVAPLSNVGADGAEATDKRSNSGVAFERRFASLMRQKLGVRRTARRVRVKGKNGTNPHECDVHGEVYSPAWDVVRYLSFGIALLAVACVLLRLFPEHASKLGRVAIWLSTIGNTVEDRARGIHASLAPYAVASLGIACGLVVEFAKKRIERHIWTECKDRKSTVKRKDISILVGSVADVRDEDSGAEWRPDEVWFASTSPFDQDALAFAREHRIRCFHVGSDGRLIELTARR